MFSNSIYNKMLQDQETRLSTGYDYNTNGMLPNFLSPILYQNPRLSTFLNLIDPALIEITESVKKIQFYTNYTIDKNDRRTNI